VKKAFLICRWGGEKTWKRKEKTGRARQNGGLGGSRPKSLICGDKKKKEFERVGQRRGQGWKGFQGKGEKKKKSSIQTTGREL